MNDNSFAPLPEEIRRALGESLPRDKVKYREQAGETLAYVDGHYVTERLNEVFDYRWSFTHDAATEIARYERETKKGRNLVVMYEVRGRLEVPGGIGTDAANTRALCDRVKRAEQVAVAALDAGLVARLDSYIAEVR